MNTDTRKKVLLAENILQEIDDLLLTETQNILFDKQNYYLNIKDNKREKNLYKSPKNYNTLNDVNSTNDNVTEKEILKKLEDDLSSRKKGSKIETIIIIVLIIFLIILFFI